jgi:hypothetical protein
MSTVLVFAALTTASAIGTVWVYWGVPHRVVANWAIGIGIGYASINALLWLFVAGAFNQSPISRIVGGVALALGIAFGGVVARVLHYFNRPARTDGA